VTLRTRGGAVLDGYRFANDTAIRIDEGNPTIDGFFLRGYTVGVAANGTAGDWTVRNLSTIGGQVGIDAANATGDWTVEGATVSRTRFDGVVARNTSGDWTVSDTRVFDTRGDGVDATEASGDWEVTGLTVKRAVGAGIDAKRADGNWTVADGDVREAHLARDESGHTITINTRGDSRCSRKECRHARVMCFCLSFFFLQSCPPLFSSTGRQLT